MMKKLFFGLIFVFALSFVNYGAVLAGFNPQQVVNDFRNLNVSGTGFDFTSNPVWGTQKNGGNAYRTLPRHRVTWLTSPRHRVTRLTAHPRSGSDVIYSKIL